MSGTPKSRKMSARANDRCPTSDSREPRSVRQKPYLDPRGDAFKAAETHNKSNNEDPTTTDPTSTDFQLNEDSTSMSYEAPCPATLCPAVLLCVILQPCSPPPPVQWVFSVVFVSSVHDSNHRRTARFASGYGINQVAKACGYLCDAKQKMSYEAPCPSL